MPAITQSLIEPEEAEKVAAAAEGVTTTFRIPLMMVLGAMIVLIVTVLILIIISFVKADTGLDTIFPFLEKETTQSLNR